MNKKNINIKKQNASKEYFALAGDNYRVVISGKETEGKYAVIDMIIPPGGGPMPHSHPKFTETFFIISGELLYKTESGKVIVTAGDFVEVPTGGAIHCFKNMSECNAHVICTVFPAGFEEFFKEIGTPVNEGEFISIEESNSEYQKRIEFVSKKYGQKIYKENFLE
ncbi:cupin domain-containing protein [Chryseobacterium sp. Chry.R1]|uniref:cupin domain-containing protein n=1 Tax=Chryseobacterium sp. Chry.R1 TaxID=3139392 RepID=UPI0031FA3E93